MHRVRAKINSARPFHTAEIGIDGDGIENVGVQQFQKYTAAPFGFNGENSAHAVVEGDLQPVLRQRFGGNDPNHDFILLQRRNFGRLLITAGQIPRLPQFRAMQLRPFEDERPCAAAHVTFHHFERVDVDLDSFALIDGMKMWRRMVAVKHANDDAVEPAQAWRQVK